MERLHKLGHGLVPWSRTADPGLVQHHHKGVNALTADNAGTAQFQTSPMRNINIMPGISQLVNHCSSLRYLLHQGNLVPGPKLQAPSCKRQAASAKPQAASPKLQAPSLKNILERSLNSFPRDSSSENIIMPLGPKIVDLGSWNKF